MSIVDHTLVSTLRSLRGNPRACVLTEPLWGIPYNLYAPYISIYMLALGLKDSQIGLLLTINLSMQILTTLFGGPITDKFGRRMTTFIFDIVVWSIPTLIWAIAQDFRYFLVAAIINGAWRVTQTSWSCLLVEDADPAQLVDIYSWIYIAGLLSAFFAPIAGLLIRYYSLVPTMRGLYVFTFIMMTLKFILLYRYSSETEQGKIRMEETRHQNLFSMMGGYRGVLKQMLRSTKTLYTLGIMLVMGAASMISGTFWAIIVTQRLRIPDAHLALYPFARSVIMLFFFFLVMPRIKELKFRNPMMVGFAGLALSQLILISLPEKSYMLLLVSTFIEACSFATVSTQIDRMLVITVAAQERARILGLLYLISIMITTPFGWIAGMLSEVNRTLPFILNIILYAAGIFLVFMAARASSREESHPTPLAVVP